MLIELFVKYNLVYAIILMTYIATLMVLSDILID